MDIANVYKWRLKDIFRLYIDESEDVKSLGFWHERAKEYIKNIQKAGRGWPL